MDTKHNGAGGALAPLRSPSVLTRKVAARSLVGVLSVSDAPQATDLLSTEDEPNVYKWLAMAVARSSYTPALDTLRAIAARTTDANARDWIEASRAVLDPFRAAREARRELQSSDAAAVRMGAIHAWGGVRGGLDLTPQLQIACAASDPPSRRWAALALHRAGSSVPSGELNENLVSGDYLLKEWSLHIVASAPVSSVRGLVTELINDHARQHPRVLEWAVHAWCALEAGPDVVNDLIDVYLSSSDLEIHEAVATQLSRRMTPTSQDFLVSLLAGNPHPLIALAVLRELPADRIDPRLSSQLGRVVSEIHGQGADMDPMFKRAGAHLVSGADWDRLKQLGKDPLRAAVMGSELIRIASQPCEHVTVNTDPTQVGVIVALQEEFEQLAAAIETPLVYDTAIDVYTASVLLDDAVPAKLHVTLTGRKGAEFAAVAASRLTSSLSLDLLVSMGISGGLDEDLRPGQIVIGDSVTAYAQNARVQGLSVHAFLPSGEPFRPDKEITDHASQLRFRAPEFFKEWHGAHERKADELGITSEPAVVLGSLASGPYVVASREFADWLLSHKRDYLAVDMESSGVALAGWAAAEPRPRLLVVRGISDGADASKRSLDRASRGAYRQLAMWSATRYLLQVLKSFPNWGSP